MMNVCLHIPDIIFLYIQEYHNDKDILHVPEYLNNYIFDEIMSDIHIILRDMVDAFISQTTFVTIHLPISRLRSWVRYSSDLFYEYWLWRYVSRNDTHLRDLQILLDAEEFVHRNPID